PPSGAEVRDGGGEPAVAGRQRDDSVAARRVVAEQIGDAVAVEIRHLHGPAGSVPRRVTKPPRPSLSASVHAASTGSYAITSSRRSPLKSPTSSCADAAGPPGNVPLVNANAPPPMLRPCIHCEVSRRYSTTSLRPS